MNYLTQWIGWSDKQNLADKIIDTLNNNKIYMPTPYQFLDVFDSQLHICPEDLINNFNIKKQDIHAIKFWIKALSWTMRTRCLSFHDPVSTKSAHMWGQYGNNGNALAIKYDKNEIDSWCKNSSSVVSKPGYIAKKVEYSNDYCPLRLAKRYLIKYFQDGNVKAHLPEITAFLEKFIFTKTLPYKNEREHRIFYHDINMFRYVIQFMEEYSVERPTENDDHRFHEYMNTLLYNGEINFCFEFIKPKEIIIGWDLSFKDQKIKKLIKYTNDNNIKIVILQPYIDYNNKVFRKNL